MPRGSVTIMEGYAADRFNHGVRPVCGKVASLLIRRMHPQLLAGDWKASNTILCRSAPPELQINQDAASGGGGVGASDTDEDELAARLVAYRPADDVSRE